MPKANLVTRTSTTSSVTEDTLNKGSALTHAEMDSNLINLRDSSWALADDTSTTLQVSNDKTITIAGGTGITTAITGDTLTITGVNQAQGITVVGDDSTGTLISDGESVKIAGGTGITTAMSGDTLTITNSSAATITALNNQAENRLTTIGSSTTELDGEANLTFDGTTLTITGDVSATGNISNDAVSITDNKISATRSNDDLKILASGTGQIRLGSDGPVSDTSLVTANRTQRGVWMVEEDLAWDPSAASARFYANGSVLKIKHTGSESSNSNNTYRGFTAEGHLDLNGINNNADTSGYRSRSIMGCYGYASVSNSSNTAATTVNSLAGQFGLEINGNQGGTGDITITHGSGQTAYVDIINLQAGQTGTIENAYQFAAMGSHQYSNDGTSTQTITNQYGYYVNGDTIATNNYAFYTEDKDWLSAIGKLESYREKINALSFSSSITVDASLAPVHTVTLGGNTDFQITNLGTGQTITLIITSDSTGSYSATFGTDTSTAVKFAGGSPTLTAAGGSIDVITIFNDGTNILGNFAGDFKVA